MSEESSNKKIIKLMRLTSQEQMILTYMEQFYKDCKNSRKLYKLLNGKTSIRLIDFFVTNYSKKNRSNIITANENKTNNPNDKIENNIEGISPKSKVVSDKNFQIFNIHSSYKSQLKAWNKKYFDPFSRGDRIPFFLNDVCIITTIGQLNFFKWFISNKIYKYVKENYNDIEKNMNSNKQINKKTQKNISTKSYYKKNQYKNNTYSNIANHQRKIETHNLSKVNKLDSKNDFSYSNNNYQKKTSKIEVRFD